MKTLGRIFVIGVAVALLFSCYRYYTITGSGRLVTRDLAYTGFDGVTIEMDAAVTITPAATHSVALTADDNIIGLVTVYPADSGERLVFDLDHVSGYDQFSVGLEIGMPELTWFGSGIGRYYYHNLMDGRADVTVAPGFSLAEPLAVDVYRGTTTIGTLSAPSADITVRRDAIFRADLTVADIAVRLEDAPTVELSGTADTLDLSTSGTYGQEYRCDLADFAVARAGIEISAGQGTFVLDVTEMISGSVADGNRVEYVDYPGLDLSGLTVDEDAVLVPLSVS